MSDGAGKCLECDCQAFTPHRWITTKCTCNHPWKQHERVATSVNVPPPPPPQQSHQHPPPPPAAKPLPEISSPPPAAEGSGSLSPTSTPVSPSSVNVRSSSPNPSPRPQTAPRPANRASVVSALALAVPATAESSSPGPTPSAVSITPPAIPVRKFSGTASSIIAASLAPSSPPASVVVPVARVHPPPPPTSVSSTPAKAVSSTPRPPSTPFVKPETSDSVVNSVSASSSSASSSIPSVSSAVSSRAPASSVPDPTFATHLTHKFDLVSEQSQSGLRVLKRVRSFFSKLGGIQEKYAHELSKAVSYERHKLLTMKQPDRMSSNWLAFMTFFEQLQRLSELNLAFATDVLEHTVEPLEKFHTIGVNMGADNKSEATRIHSELDKHRVEVDKDRNSLSKLLTELNNKRNSAASSSSGSSSSLSLSSSASSAALSSSASVLSSSLFKSTDPVKSFQKTKDKAVKLCDQYQASVGAANTYFHRYHKHELPKLLTSMQSLEEMRLHSLHSALGSFSSLQQEFAKQVNSVSDNIRSAAKLINSSSDLKGFINQVVHDHGPAIPYTPFSYDLSISPTELKSMSYTESESANTNSLFYSNLEGVLKFESTALTPASLSTIAGDSDLPLIVPTLFRAVMSHGGVTEGIFRISASGDELQSLRQQLQKGNYVIASHESAHTCACLFKSWCRDLSEPVIPFATYESCIEVGKIEEFSPTTPAHFNAVKAIITALPAVNKKTLFYILTFMKMLSKPEHVAVTRMNLANLALVLSPGLIRSSNQDPLKMLTDTKFATLFLQHAATLTPSVFSPDMDSIITGFEVDGAHSVSISSDSSVSASNSAANSHSGGFIADDDEVLPAGWTKCIDATTKCPYYINVELNVSVWEKPTT